MARRCRDGVRCSSSSLRLAIITAVSLNVLLIVGVVWYVVNVAPPPPSQSASTSSSSTTTTSHSHVAAAKAVAASRGSVEAVVEHFDVDVGTANVNNDDWDGDVVDVAQRPSTTTTTTTTTKLRVPALLYGTAWKKDETSRHVLDALESGFVGLDTAAQPQHYSERGVGQALATALQRGVVTRAQLWVQTKFCPPHGQDFTVLDKDPSAAALLPYDRNSDVAAQLHTSLAQSLVNLQLDYVDAFLLHAPYTSGELTDNDRTAWRTMEDMVLQRPALHGKQSDRQQVRSIGIANVSADQLRALLSSPHTRVPPSFVQNRCRADNGWDAEVRRICREHGVRYQAFSLLTANWKYLSAPAVVAMAHRHRVTPQQLFFLFARQLGIISLSGTTTLQHMFDDVSVMRPSHTGTSEKLTAAEMRMLETIASGATQQLPQMRHSRIPGQR